MPPTTYKLLTIHSPLSEVIDNTLMDKIGANLKAKGITKWWVRADALPDIVVMIEVPDDMGQSG